jgi:hypothetical protein
MRNPEGSYIYSKITMELRCDPGQGRTQIIIRFYKHTMPPASKLLKTSALIPFEISAFQTLFRSKRDMYCTEFQVPGCKYQQQSVKYKVQHPATSNRCPISKINPK